MDWVLVKYRDSGSGSVGWFQMDISEARGLFRRLRRNGGLYWFCVVLPYKVWYYNRRGWFSGFGFLRYC